MINFYHKPYNQLSIDELYDILALRADVFVVEQNCPYLDPDEKDKEAIHIMGTLNQKLVAYARVLYIEDKLSFGRVVTASHVRKEGYGKKLMDAILYIIDCNYPGSPIEISAQAYLERFYAHYQFKRNGLPYLEDGIPHIKMIRSI